MGLVLACAAANAQAAINWTGNGGANWATGSSWSVATLPGDANFDRAVTFNDLVVLARRYGAGVASQDSWWRGGNFSPDGKVDFNDLVILAQNYGLTAALPTAATSLDFAADLALAGGQVPEPASAAALFLGLTASLRSLRRRAA